jgi:transcriptional regulator with XRE-family HTH domain
MPVARRNPLFQAADANEVRIALVSANGELIGKLRGGLAAAFEGSPEGARQYVCSYRLLAEELIGEAHRTLRDAVVDAGNGRLAIADAHGQPARALFGVLENASVEAPFTSWANEYDAAEAVALYAANHVRSLVGAHVLTPPAEPLRLFDDLAAQRFQRCVRRELSEPGNDDPLVRLMRLFKLSKSELGRLFGVSRQAVDGWLTNGVPADREEKLATLLALADLLERKLKTDRIPGIARRPADAYGGKTMLELIGEDRQRELLGLVRDSFAWSQAA